MKIDKRSNGETIRMVRGQTATLTLEEKPTAGYRWQVVTDGAPVCALGDNGFAPASAGAVGGAGEHTWTLTAKDVGTTSIRMHYGRKWEGAAEPRAVFSLDVSVQAAAGF